MKGLATISKSLRLPPEIVEEIEKWPGNTFTEKIVIMVRSVSIERDRLLQDIDRMKSQKAKLVADVYDLDRALEKLRSINGAYSEIYTLMVRAKDRCKIYADVMDRVTKD